MSELPNFAELKNKINSWDIDAEEMLLKKIKIFTDNYNLELGQFSRNLDSFDMHLTTAEIENYKAYSQLKNLSANQFMEDILEEKTEQEQVPQEEINKEKQNQNVLLDIESKKKAVSISLQHLQEIISKKGKDKEVIEDDTVSVSSSRLNLDTFSKYVRMPFIIGSEEFKNDKTIGLTLDKGENKEEENENNKKEENDSEDSDVEEFVADIPVDDKVKAKWEEVKEKKKQQKEKLKNSQKVNEQNYEFEKDKKPDKETDNGFLVIENEDIIDNNNNTLDKKPEPAQVQNIVNQNNDNNNNNLNNNNVANDNNKENNNALNNKNNLNNKEENNNKIIENNNENKKTKDINSLKKKNILDPKLSNFLGGVDLGDDDEDDYDMDDGLFSRKNRAFVPKPNPIPIPNQNNNMNMQPQMIEMPQNNQLPIPNQNMKNMFGDESDDDDEDEKPMK